MASANSHHEEAQAHLEFQKCISDCIKIAAMRCAVDLSIPDILEKHTAGSGAAAMTLAELSSMVGCSPSHLYHIMRLLSHWGIFKEVKIDVQDSSIGYAQTTMSRFLMKSNEAPLFLLLSSPEMLSMMLSVTNFLLSKDGDKSPFEIGYGVDMWEYIESNPSFNKLFNDAMACKARFIISTVIENYPKVFEGITSLVDVGGGNGTTLCTLVKACPWISRAINFDLPRVVSPLISDGPVQHIGGDMFETIPSADSVLIMSVLHDWDDEACVKILKNCKCAISREMGKVIIVEIVIPDGDDDGVLEKNNRYQGIHLAIDVLMMSQMKGKERTAKEWGNVVKAAGFTKHNIKHIAEPSSVIKAYP